MKLLFGILLVVVVLVVVAMLLKKGGAVAGSGAGALDRLELEGKSGTFSAKQIATANEQGMYWRLVAAFPAVDFIVLTQVSFGALLLAKGGASRYSFAQKIADFVVTNRGFKVLAIVELDDRSHRGREKQDASRDAMLAEAGYKVLRYTSIPAIELLVQDIKE